MNKKENPVKNEIRVRLSTEQYGFVDKSAKEQYEGNLSQFVRSIIMEKMSKKK